MIDTHSVMTPEELAELGVSVPEKGAWHTVRLKAPAMSPFGEFEIVIRCKASHTFERFCAWLGRCNERYGWGGHVEVRP